MLHRNRCTSILIALAASLLVLTACGGSDTPATSTPRPAATATPAVRTPLPATSTPAGTARPRPTFTAAPPMTIDVNKRYFANVTTNKGAFRLELLPKQAPVTVNSFVFLARQGFFDGTKFHRVINGFMIQGGDPLSADDSRIAQWGTGSPGYAIPDEFLCADGKIVNVLRPSCPLATKFDRAGLLAMANTGRPQTGGSQLFITLGPTQHLDGGHTIFGQVASGMNVVQAIGAVSTQCSRTGQNEPLCVARPDQPVIIQSVVIEEQ